MTCDRRQAGFSFHELLVALTITSVAVLGYAATTAGVLRGGHSTANYTRAANSAHDKMEQLKASGVGANGSECDKLDDVITPLTVFDRCWTISDSSLGKNLKQIEVRVVWTDSESREVVVTTLAHVE